MMDKYQLCYYRNYAVYYRRVTPGLVEMLQDPLLEMDPEQQVDEEYK